ncbi:hypothetical protein [Lentzea cavernae]|uniref:Multidrug transporter n=1 Tax=Lentzea cavernae TaxID=2020703 RepID=A0ABQ3MIW2_9PSEU|nr:hypothetical protein [Lentzea cavernae]GHH47250.1 hypothetical protein GCM10017774_51200 [Lentzea cavernae]
MSEHQFTTPEGGGEPVDEEPDAIAVVEDGEHVTAAEETAMHIEESEEGGGRVDRPGDGYLDS